MPSHLKASNRINTDNPIPSSYARRSLTKAFTEARAIHAAIDSPRSTSQPHSTTNISLSSFTKTSSQSPQVSLLLTSSRPPGPQQIITATVLSSIEPTTPSAIVVPNSRQRIDGLTRRQLAAVIILPIYLGVMVIAFAFSLWHRRRSDKRRANEMYNSNTSSGVVHPDLRQREKDSAKYLRRGSSPPDLEDRIRNRAETGTNPLTGGAVFDLPPPPRARPALAYHNSASNVPTLETKRRSSVPEMFSTTFDSDETSDVTLPRKRPELLQDSRSNSSIPMAPTRPVPVRPGILKRRETFLDSDSFTSDLASPESIFTPPPVPVRSPIRDRFLRESMSIHDRSSIRDIIPMHPAAPTSTPVNERVSTRHSDKSSEDSVRPPVPNSSPASATLSNKSSNKSSDRHPPRRPPPTSAPIPIPGSLQIHPPRLAEPLRPLSISPIASPLSISPIASPIAISPIRTSARFPPPTPYGAPRTSPNPRSLTTSLARSDDEVSVIDEDEVEFGFANRTNLAMLQRASVIDMSLMGAPAWSPPTAKGKEKGREERVRGGR